MERGLATINKKERESPKPQTSGAGGIIRKHPNAPPITPFRRRKVGDKVRTPNNRIGIIVEVRGNGSIEYLVRAPGMGKKWYSDSELGGKG